MARGRTYNKTYADVHMKEDIIREVGSFLEELIVKDIAPLKMIKKDFPITNPPIRDLRDFAPSVSYETIREFCYIIGYYLHEEENAVRNGGKHLDDKEAWLAYLSDLNKNCDVSCDYNRRILAKEVARRIFKKYIGKGCKDIERLKVVLGRISKLIVSELNDEPFSRELLSCVKVYLWRHFKYDSHLRVAQNVINNSLSKK